MLTPLIKMVEAIALAVERLCQKDPHKEAKLLEKKYQRLAMSTFRGEASLGTLCDSLTLKRRSLKTVSLIQSSFLTAQQQPNLGLSMTKSSGAKGQSPKLDCSERSASALVVLVPLRLSKEKPILFQAIKCWALSIPSWEYKAHQQLYVIVP